MRIYILDYDFYKNHLDKNPKIPFVKFSRILSNENGNFIEIENYSRLTSFNLEKMIYQEKFSILKQIIPVLTYYKQIEIDWCNIFIKDNKYFIGGNFKHNIEIIDINQKIYDLSIRLKIFNLQKILEKKYSITSILNNPTNIFEIVSPAGKWIVNMERQIDENCFPCKRDDKKAIVEIYKLNDISLSALTEISKIPNITEKLVFPIEIFHIIDLLFIFLPFPSRDLLTISNIENLRNTLIYLHELNYSFKNPKILFLNNKSYFTAHKIYKGKDFVNLNHSFLDKKCFHHNVDTNF